MIIFLTFGFTIPDFTWVKRTEKLHFSFSMLNECLLFEGAMRAEQIQDLT